MLYPLLTIIPALALLLWGADRFVEGAASIAKYAGMKPLFIGMIVVGFGTSAPEMIVSAMASINGNPDLSLGNAFGSNITNIALILGLTAMMKPVIVKSSILHKELPLLSIVTSIVAYLLFDGNISREDAITFLLLFTGIVLWSILTGTKESKDSFGKEMLVELKQHPMSRKMAIVWTIVGLIFLVVSSRILVWAAVTIALKMGVGELVIGLTIVAIGTSLPELASSLIASRKGENDIALGNILGSNLFNTLAVVGIAGIIHPFQVPREVLIRDYPIMSALTLSLFIMGYSFKGQGRINRLEGMILFLSFIAYTSWILYTLIK